MLKKKKTKKLVDKATLLIMTESNPIRKVAQLMKEEVLKAQPQYKDLLVPHCVALMYCPEGHGCGAYPSKEKVEELIKKGKEKDKPFELD